jgi:cell division protease FtsH
MNVPAADPVHKATIIPRGRALGMVMQLPEGDKLFHEVQADDLAPGHHDGWACGGRADLRPENVTSGAQSDIDQATCR